jgi:hypothetical protein
MLKLLLLVAAVVYVGGVWKFWNGFHRTSFNSGRPYLALLWPVFMTSRSFRQNFQRALKG